MDPHRGLALDTPQHPGQAVRASPPPDCLRQLAVSGPHALRLFKQLWVNEGLVLGVYPATVAVEPVGPFVAEKVVVPVAAGYLVETCSLGVLPLP